MSRKKPSTKEKLFLFVNIYFIHENVAQPIVLFGLTELKEEEFNNSWSALMLTSSGPNFVTSDLLEYWDTFNEKSESSINLIHYKVKPLVDFGGQVITETMCLDLIDKFKEIKTNRNGDTGKKVSYVSKEK